MPTDLELDGLSPDRDYRYTVTGIGDVPVTGGFRTARATGKAAKDRAAVEFVRSQLSGASGQVDDTQAMWPRKAE